MIKRSIYYWSGVYRKQLQKGMSYIELNRVIAINILNFDLFTQTDQFHTTYHLYEDEEKYELTDVMEFHFIEMTKLIKDWRNNKLNPWDDVLARWLLILGMVDHRNGKIYDAIFRELEEIAMKDETLQDAFKSWGELSLTREQRLAYESRLKRKLDKQSAIREAELRLQEGIAKGREEVKETVARRLLAKGMDIDTIAEVTRLEKERIIEMQ